jgi:hypothetical protein
MDRTAPIPRADLLRNLSKRQPVQFRIERLTPGACAVSTGLSEPMRSPQVHERQEINRKTKLKLGFSPHPWRGESNGLDATPPWELVHRGLERSGKANQPICQRAAALPRAGLFGRSIHIGCCARCSLEGEWLAGIVAAGMPVSGISSESRDRRGSSVGASGFPIEVLSSFDPISRRRYP